MARQPLYPHIPARKTRSYDADIEALTREARRSGCPACARYLERIRLAQKEQKEHGGDTSSIIEATLRHWRYHMSHGNAHPRGFSFLDKMWTA